MGSRELSAIVTWNHSGVLCRHCCKSGSTPEPKAIKLHQQDYCFHWKIFIVLIHISTINHLLFTLNYPNPYPSVVVNYFLLDDWFVLLYGTPKHFSFRQLSNNVVLGNSLLKGKITLWKSYLQPSKSAFPLNTDTCKQYTDQEIVRKIYLLNF